MTVLGVIPARYASSRFPGKPLVPILGRPLVLHAADATARALGRDHTVVATDDERIAAVVRDAGFRVVMTSGDALTGTDRLWEVATQLPADVYINVQGDEPMLDPLDIVAIADAKRRQPGFVINGVHPLDPSEDPSDRNIPKVVINESGVMLYISRSPIPGYKSDANRPREYLKQVCIYAFNRSDLDAFASLGRKSTTEWSEDIEILRFFELGIPVQTVRTRRVSLAVDTPDDVDRVERAMSSL